MHILYFHQRFCTSRGAIGIRSCEVMRRLRHHAYSATFLRYAGGSLWIALTDPNDIAFATTTPLTPGLPAIATIPNDCDIYMFRSAAPWFPKGVRAGNLLAIFAGTHGVASGLDTVPAVVRTLQNRGHKDINLALIGDGKPTAGLQERADRKGLRNLISHPSVYKARLVVASADLGLQILESIPTLYFLVVLSPTYSSIIARRTAGAKQLFWLASMIEDCGFAVPPHDAPAFAEALERVAADRVALTEKGARAASLAERHFDRSKLADQWVDWVTDGRKA